jgi:predicted RNA-binding protein with PIN domain
MLAEPGGRRTGALQGSHRPADVAGRPAERQTDAAGPCPRGALRGGAYTGRVPRPDPFLEASLLVVDGRNVLGAMQRTRGAVPEQALLSRLWTVVGPRTRILVVFDGMRDGGAMMPERSSRLGVRWSRHESADDLIVRIVADSPGGTLVATDDIELGGRVRSLGASSVRSRELIERFARQRPSAPSVGQARPVVPAAGSGPAGHGKDATAEVAHRAWSPGRGATRKKGNPKRGHAPG